jgi:hypothetical protein
VPQRLIKNSKLTNRQINELIKYFALEVPASRAAKVMNINRHSAERVYQVIRRRLSLVSKQPAKSSPRSATKH